jgi:ABC-type glycerol-3-phosphate transport system substrate-binding protein
VIWTDTPEMALYAELFNAAQGRYRIEVRYKDNLAEAIRTSRAAPDLAVGRYLKSAGVRDRFQGLDYLFGELTINQAAFYPGLLAQGSLSGRQILLPVSYDLPALIFVGGGAANPKGKLLLGMEDLAAESAAFNQTTSGSFTRMGFSPRWDPDFLVIAAQAMGAGFREGRPLAWSESGLDAALDRLRTWTATVNGSATLEDDFQFKYLYTPAYNYIIEGRVLYAYMSASNFFLVPEDKRSALDFRWFSEGSLVPPVPDIVFAAIPRAARDKPAAEAFLKWFFRDENQKAMLESARKTRSIEGSFGVAGGFSAVRSVTERVFPHYYPALVGHLPPADAISMPGALPDDWPEIENAVLSPWLLEATGRRAGTGPRPGEELAARLAAWAKAQGR